MSGPGLRAILDRHQAALSLPDGQFLARIFATPAAVYETRLRRYGLQGLERVLDAGCGFGQWSLALATLNRTVAACDVSAARLAVLKDLAAAQGSGAILAQRARLEALPFRDASFDAVFAYSALQFTPWKASLRELARVLRPGRMIYLNACGIGWYKHLWYGGAQREDGFDTRSIAARVLLNTFRYDRHEPIEDGLDILIEPEELRRELQALGCAAIEEAAEGCLGDPSQPSRPFFQGSYLGDLGVYEMLARKR